MSKPIGERGQELRRQGRRGGVVLRGVPEHRPVDSCACLFCIRSRDADRQEKAAAWLSRRALLGLKRRDSVDFLGFLVLVALLAMFLLAEFMPVGRQRVVRPIEKPQFREYRSTSQRRPMP